jgi:hypothetical protein
MSDVEDCYPMTWVQGESITVHMDKLDLVFYHRDKKWVADFSDWIISEEDHAQELCPQLNLMTVSEKEDLYTRKDVLRALKAGEFLKSLGYPTQWEAIGLVRDGNVRNVPHTVVDVKHFFDIYGPQVPGVRGRTTETRKMNKAQEHRGAKMQITRQEMTADIMYVAQQKMLVSVSKPLGLTLSIPVISITNSGLGKCMQAHINMLQSRGFKPVRIYFDPAKVLHALEGSFLGIEVNTSGAGDHLNQVDTKIRRIKELMRAVLAGLPYKLSRERIKNLVNYAVSRTNLKRTQGLIATESPRVRFTGMKPDYKSEFGLSFGDNVEAFNPIAEKKTNDVRMPRTEPCIALYPSANKNGSWVMYNLNTKSYV